MCRWIAVSGLSVLAMLIVIQFIPVDTSNPPVTADIPSSPCGEGGPSTSLLRLPLANETRWPWYSRVAPASWLTARDVREGRAELNFSTWNEYSRQQRVKKIKESWEEVAEGETAPWFYLPAHRDARLSAEDRVLLRDWAWQR